ncbi:RNA polymerase sigma factor SigF [Streptomyces hirsutus]|uniref:RNA polymerase sigma factor SigF n=1 Tax=Streptomyces hirsutus TaxID=35620 RepID=A0ABZ1GSF8_9ACTN|nr:RNA polymerase sigma factor SigF [Streptomyces hirsutus]WSD08855.1 RNA polymerase sigma factor SigF [Streptomyces hirsutus]WTD17690.1 RNA polymerase sigma factor SigF [Streptomyces hirsutus]WTD77433.1 RNA polymerase sigma factor SigF [Streptomyces sp. NBC_01635]
MRDEERGTRELPAERVSGGIEGIDAIPEQARPHPEDDAPVAGAPDDGQHDPAARSRPEAGRPRTSPGPGGGRARGEPVAGDEASARGRATGGTMNEHERHAESEAPRTPGAQGSQRAPDTPGTHGAQRDPQDRSGARALFLELRTLQDGTPEYAELRNRLVRMHLPLVEHLARRFRNRGEPLDDLTQVATIGLIKSVDRFDPDRGVEFSTYATPTVVGEIKRHFRDKGWAVRVPRRLQELRLALTTATAELSQQHGRSPTVHELAEKLAISEEEVLEGLESANAYSTLSLDVPDTDDDSPAVADTLGAEDEALEGVEYRESLKPLLEDLPPREKRILLLRFFGNMTQSQIAQEVGISQMHVSRLLARTLAQLREKLLVEE